MILEKRMRQAWARILSAAALAMTLAGAQTAPDPSVLTYRTRPTEDDVQALYPRRAWGERINGQVVLCCLPHASGNLACAVIGESPAGWSFAAAAEEVARGIRLTTQSANAVREAGRPLRIPISFNTVHGQAAPPFEREPICGVSAEQSEATPNPSGQSIATNTPGASASSPPQ